MFMCPVVTLTNPSSSASRLISPLSSLSERRLATDVEKGISFMKGAFSSTCSVGMRALPRIGWPRFSPPVTASLLTLKHVVIQRKPVRQIVAVFLVVFMTLVEPAS